MAANRKRSLSADESPSKNSDYKSVIDKLAEAEARMKLDERDAEYDDLLRRISDVSGKFQAVLGRASEVTEGKTSSKRRRLSSFLGF